MVFLSMLFAISTGGLVTIADVSRPGMDAELDRQFKCPEESPNLGAHIHQLALWLHAAKTRHPHWSDEQIAKLRHELRLKHHCTGRMHAPANSL